MSTPYDWLKKYKGGRGRHTMTTCPYCGETGTCCACVATPWVDVLMGQPATDHRGSIESLNKDKLIAVAMVLARRLRASFVSPIDIRVRCPECLSYNIDVEFTVILTQLPPSKWHTATDYEANDEGRSCCNDCDHSGFTLDFAHEDHQETATGIKS